MGQRSIIWLTAFVCLASVATWLIVEPTAALSIERELPVRVTNRNSGPRYEVDEVEKTKLTDSTTSNSNNNNDDNNNNNNNQDDKRNAIEQPADDAPIPVGHMTIRRIFLVPMMSGPRPDWQSSQGTQQGGETNLNNQPDSSQPGDNNMDQPSLFARPFWPFLTPVRRPAHHHLFGADESSRSPTVGREQDREREGDSIMGSGSVHNNNNNNNQPDQPAPGIRPAFDPIQMMLEMMQAALSGQDGSAGVPPNFHDLAHEANTVPRPDNGDNVDKPIATGTELDRPIKPTSNNETKEDVVEIDGKKFLRKVVINRHVGENIVFMTKRLIFTPLNETNPTSDTTTTTTTTVASTNDGANQESVTTSKSKIVPASPIDQTDKPATREVPDEATTTTTVATTSENSNEEPTTTKSPSLATSPTTTTTTTITSAQPEDTTTAKANNSWVEGFKEAVERAAERLVEKAEAKLDSDTTTTATITEKPAPSLIMI